MPTAIENLATVELQALERENVRLRVALGQARINITLQMTLDSRFHKEESPLLRHALDVIKEATEL